MKQICLRGSWIIRASRDEVYEIISDFENMPIYFPQVAKSMQIIERAGNVQTINAEAKSFGTTFPLKMITELLPSMAVFRVGPR